MSDPVITKKPKFIPPPPHFWPPRNFRHKPFSGAFVPTAVLERVSDLLDLYPSRKSVVEKLLSSNH